MREPEIAPGRLTAAWHQPILTIHADEAITWPSACHRLCGVSSHQPAATTQHFGTLAKAAGRPAAKQSRAKCAQPEHLQALMKHKQSTPETPPVP